MTDRQCNGCLATKPITAFEKAGNGASYRRTCRACRLSRRDLEKDRARHREYMKLKRETDPQKVKDAWERCVYGVSKSELGITSCQICGRNSNLAIDHCHTTKKVRGVICRQCNSAIGLFADDPNRLKAAIEYLGKSAHIELDRKVYP